MKPVDTAKGMGKRAGAVQAGERAASKRCERAELNGRKGRAAVEEKKIPSVSVDRRMVTLDSDDIECAKFHPKFYFYACDLNVVTSVSIRLLNYYQSLSAIISRAVWETI